MKKISNSPRRPERSEGSPACGKDLEYASVQRSAKAGRSFTAFRMTWGVTIIMLCVLLLWGTQVWSDPVSDALQAKLNAIRTMSATFNQVVNAKQREISRSSGTMALARPGHFRWET